MRWEYFLNNSHKCLVVSIYSMNTTDKDNIYFGDKQHLASILTLWFMKANFVCWFLSKPRWSTQVWSDICCQHGGRGQREHHECWGRLHGRCQNNCERADPFQVNVWRTGLILYLVLSSLNLFACVSRKRVWNLLN